jgi:replicative DNA helicase
MTKQAHEQRQPPYTLEAEQALLGALMWRNEGLDQVIDFLEADHFFDKLHGEIYTTIAKMVFAGQKATPVTLKTYFENAEPIDAETSAVAYLGRLAARAVMIIDPSIRDYGRTIFALATRRQLIVIGEDIAHAAYNTPFDFPPKEQIEEAETRLFSLVERGERSGSESFGNVSHAALQAVREAHDGKKTGIETGFVDLDEKLGGLEAGDLIILAGRPSMGKSALATNIVRFVACTRTSKHPGGIPVGVFSLEMGAQQIALRVMGDLADVSPDRIRRGKLVPNELAELTSKTAEFEGLPIHIDETGGLSVAQVAARARRMKRKHKIALLVIDYLQLMHAGRRTENRVQDVSVITTGLKALAKELGIPILALSQLSRAVEGRDNKRPQLSDLRESGAIEQDADVVLFIYREEYYFDQKNPRPSPKEAPGKFADWDAARKMVVGKAEVIIGKQRQGATGIVSLHFANDLMRFSNLAGGQVRHG